MSTLFSNKIDFEHTPMEGGCELEKVVSSLLAELKSETCAMTLAQKQFVELDRLITRLEQCIFNASPSLHEEIQKQFTFQEIACLNEGYQAWETILEKLFVEQVETGHMDTFKHYRLTSRFERLISREVSMLSGKPVRNALFIGSGPVPISAIWMHKMLQAPIDCLDIDEMAIDASKAFLKNVGLENRLQVIHEASSEYDVSKYDVIVIALLAKPKQEILANISQSMGVNCQVICRTSHGLRNLLYEPTLVTREILGDFSIKEQRIINGESDDTISSLLLAQH